MNDPIINVLRAEQSKVAQDFFKRPPKMTDVSFEYGYAQGLYTGLELAIARILKLYKDDKDDTFD